MKCGLLGRNLSHSYSPQIHTFLGEYTYELYEREPGTLAEFFNNATFTGINVTIPYKKDVIPFCHRLTDTAKKLGAVNTIVRCSDGTLIGHNTDYFGFSSMVMRTGLCVANKKVLVLGSGGASSTAVAVMTEHGAEVIVISRSGKNNYSNLALHRDAAVIVNATPVGMYPNNGESPVDLALFPNLEGVLDMVYNPARTKLLLDAEERGIIAENGLWMLIAQAKESAEWFLGRKLDNSLIDSIHHTLSIQMQNIVLIGMPGCGKTTVAALLAEQIGRPVIDLDKEIVQEAGCDIPRIFREQGEQKFRQLETHVLAKLSKQSGVILSTGGGCVTREENYPLLHQNGRIIWLQRDIHSLPTDGRPISQRNDLSALFQAREPMYRRFADHIVDNNGTVEETLEAIRRLL